MSRAAIPIVITRRPIPALPFVLVGSLVAAGCSDRDVAMDSAGGDDTTTTAGTADASTSNGSADATSAPADTTAAAETSSGTTGGSPECPVPGEECTLIDVLIVVDNSGTMAQEQAHVAANFGPIVAALEGLDDINGSPAHPSVNLMVTTTDVGHPLCADPDGSARRGAPVHDGCNSRIASFADGAVDVQSACTDVCPEDVVPTDPFLHFDSVGTNVPGGTPAQALACLGPQGIDGCAYKSPLEAMLLALDPAACWNDPSQPGCTDDPQWAGLDKPFLRDGATLAIMIISDGVECSVDAPDGEVYFTDDDVYWEIDPDTGMPAASPAVCWNAGVTCEGPDENGAWTGCMSTDNPVLHPTDRYRDALRDLGEMRDKDIVMLGILGVPEVFAHNPQPPFEPTAGGIYALQQRPWTEADLTPAELDAGVTVEHKVWEFGDIAPGCANERGTAIFPNRVHEVCAGLNIPDDPGTDPYEAQVRCCIESICDDDYSEAMRCLTGGIGGQSGGLDSGG
jgi:hypothetical protein